MPGPTQKNWMDSGAFTAFTLGVQQSIPAYCEFIKRQARYVDHYAVLDVIGSAPKTWDNQMEMEKLGTNPIPCFHYGEDPRWLIKYLDRYPYIAIGGMVPIARAQLVQWLDELWRKYLVTSTGQPRAKMHGFGLTTFDLMRRYPWFSVDSSSWLQSGAFGLVVMIDARGDILRVNVSDQHHSTGVKGQHYQTETPANQEAIRKLVATYGFSVEDLAGHHEPRRLISALTYKRYAERHCAYRPLQLGQMTLWDNTGTSTNGYRAADPWPAMELYFAGDVTLWCELELHRRECHRMFTYHLLSKKDSRQWSARKDLRDGKKVSLTSSKSSFTQKLIRRGALPS